MSKLTRKVQKKVADRKTIENDPQEDLLKTIKITNRMLKEQNSYWYVFKLSIFRGLGTAIGASIVFAMFIYFMDLMIKWLDYIPIFSPILEYINEWISTYLTL